MVAVGGMECDGASGRTAVEWGEVLFPAIGRRTEHYGAYKMHQRGLSRLVFPVENIDILRQRFEGQPFPDAKPFHLNFLDFHNVFSVGGWSIQWSVEDDLTTFTPRPAGPVDGPMQSTPRSTACRNISATCSGRMVLNSVIPLGRESGR